ncbi:MAG: 5-formyltetrahydrofolate cyclo-ligase [Bacteroidales bacterium]|nr:5-formyltetrahydrofolate cyclo-ligase [Bacteroidales bacterium]
MTIDEEKNKLRKYIKTLKKGYSEEYFINISRIIFNNVDTLDMVKETNYIMSYWSLPDEVHTHEWNHKKYKLGKTILLPSIDGKKIILKIYKGKENMIPMPPFNIYEPIGEPFNDYNKIKIVIVPGIAFDKNCNRLGRGKAYYDNFLREFNAIKIGVCFEFQLFNNIPFTENDIKMDYVITENEIYKRTEFLLDNKST